MRSKQINYRKGATGLTGSNSKFEPVKKAVSPAQTSSLKKAALAIPASVQPAAVTVNNEKLIGIDQTITPTTLTPKIETADISTNAESAPVADHETQEAVTTLGNGSAQSQPETIKPVNYRTWIIVGITALILLYLYRKK